MLLETGQYNLFFSHNDYISKPPNNFKTLYNKNLLIGIESNDKLRFGFQFHPEGTLDGKKIIEKFINHCIYSKDN